MTSSASASGEFSRASSKADRSASGTTPDSGPSLRQTVATRLLPRRPASSAAMSTMLSAIDSSCMTTPGYIRSILIYHFRSAPKWYQAQAPSATAVTPTITQPVESPPPPFATPASEGSPTTATVVGLLVQSI